MSTLDDAIQAHMAHGAGTCADPLTDSLVEQTQPRTRETNDWAQAVNERNARTTRRASSAADLVLVIVVGALLAWALVVYVTPCQAGALCMAAVIPTQPSVLHRLRLTLRAWRLRWQLADTQAWLRYVEDELDELPEVRQQLRRRHDALLVCLADCELGQRSN